MLQPLKQDLERQVIKYRVFRSLTTTKIVANKQISESIKMHVSITTSFLI